MTPKIPVLTDKAPKPLPGVFSQAIIANGVVYCSGAVAMDPTTGKLIDGDIKAHTVCSSQPQFTGKRAEANSTCSVRPTAPMYQEPEPRTRGGRDRHHTGGQGQRILGQHGPFCRDELGVCAILG